MKEEITKELLEYLYFKEGLSWKGIKSRCKLSSKAIREYKSLFNIRKKTQDEILADTVKTNMRKYGCSNPMQNKNIQTKAKETNMKKYGCPNPMQNKNIQTKAKETIKRENVVAKRKQTCLDKYGVEIVSQNKQVLSKMYKTNIERYGSYCSCNNPEVKAKIIEKVTKAFSTGEPKKKEYETRQKNNSWNLSRKEEEIYQLLLTKFSKEDVTRQYRSEFYPYNCDFYIHSLDLYIEYQGTWVHGKEPFNSNNPEHIAKLSEWQNKDSKYFRYACKVWTYQDPLKREIAQENNLNWKEFFTVDEVKAWLGRIN